MLVVLLVPFGLLGGRLLGKSCPLGWPCIPIVFCLFLFLVIYRIGFESGIWVLIAPAPIHLFFVSFSDKSK